MKLITCAASLHKRFVAYMSFVFHQICAVAAIIDLKRFFFNSFNPLK